jgi:hypothetical protein
VRGEGDVVFHYSTIEGVFSIFNLGIIGVDHHCGDAQLHRNIAEFDFRYNRRTALKVSGSVRAVMLLDTIRDKRLTYGRIGEASYA